jgi:tetratricopeptide (TPR) repeat protein
MMDGPMRLLMLRLLIPCLLTAACLPALSQQFDPNTVVTRSTPQQDTATAHAAQLIAAGELDEALTELKALAVEQQEPAGVERMLGFVYYQQSELNNAEKAFKKALARDPRDLKSMQMLGITLFRLGRPADAIPILEAERLPSINASVDPSYVLGLCYMDVQRYDDARRMIAAEYGLPAEAPSTYLLMGRLLLRREYVPAAEEAGKKALASNPNLPLAHELLGEIDLARSDISQAIAEFQTERAVNPLYGGLYERLGDAYFRAGDYQLSLQALDRAVLLEPNSTGPYILLGKVFLQRNDPLMAMGYLQRALRMDPGNYITHFLLGKAYSAIGRTREASVEFETVRQMQYGNKR